VKLLLISHGFPPVSHSGVFRAASFAKYLPEFGIDVIVLTAAEPLDGLLHYPQQDTINGTDVVRVPFNDSTAPWTRKFRSLALRVPGLSGTTRNRQLFRRAKSIWSRACAIRDFGDIDGVLATSPPPVALVLGSHIARLLGVPLWCDLRDPWTYCPGTTYRTWFDFWTERGVERRLLNDAKGVIANTESAKRELLAEFGLRSKNVEVIPNGFDERSCQASTQRATESSKPKQCFDVVYAGLGVYRPEIVSRRGHIRRRLGLDVSPIRADYNTRSPFYILSALQKASMHNPQLRDVLRFRWIGPLDANTQQLFRRYENCFEIDAPGGVSEHEALEAIFTADLLVLLQIELFRGSRDYSILIPAKSFTYLRSGKPILVAVQPGELTNLMSTFSGCTTVLPRDVNHMAEVVSARFQEWTLGKNCWHDRRAALGAYERRHLASRVADFVQARPQSSSGTVLSQ